MYSSACLEGGSHETDCPKPCRSQDKQYLWLPPHPLIHFLVEGYQLGQSCILERYPLVLISEKGCKSFPHDPVLSPLLYLCTYTWSRPLQPCFSASYEVSLVCVILLPLLTKPSLGSGLSSPFSVTLTLKFSTHKILLKTCKYGQVKQSNADLFQKSSGEREKRKEKSCASWMEKQRALQYTEACNLRLRNGCGFFF